MANHLSLSRRIRLERAYANSQSTGRARTRLATPRQHRWQRMMAVLAPPREPYVRQVRSADGRLLYLACDPATGARRLFETEADLRLWLERRYRR